MEYKIRSSFPVSGEISVPRPARHDALHTGAQHHPLDGICPSLVSCKAEEGAMNNQRIKAWLPAIRTGTGTEIFTRRLAQSLEKYRVDAQITWFSPIWEPLAPMLRVAQAPAGTDIIFTNSWNGFAFRRNGLPLVVTLHHGRFALSGNAHHTLAQTLYRRLLIQPYELRSFSKADAITAVSHHIANSLLPSLHGGQAIHVIHNWIDTEIFKPQNSPNNTFARPFRLLYVGKPSRIKGGDLLAPLMHNLGHAFELHIAGNTSPEFSSTMPNNVRTLGWLDQAALIRAYHDCDALVCPSHSEGFSYAVLEAMACGKPVIASNVAALPELVKAGVNGMLCNDGDVAGFIAATRSLAADRGKCRAFGAASRMLALDFSEADAMRQYLSLITKLCGTRQVARLEKH